jgi:TRAP-type C4-dicarboxylate transport system permease small subunit
MDISQFVLIWAVFIGSGYSFQEHGHVRVDLFTEHMRPKLRKTCAIFAYTFAALFVAALGYSCFRMLRTTLRLRRLTNSMVQIPQWILIAAMIFGCLMMLITLVCIALDLVGDGKKYL